MSLAYLSAITLPGASYVRDNPLPNFRNQKLHASVRTTPSLPPEYAEKLGENLAFRVLPYKMQDNYDRSRENCVLKTAILENDIMKATFLTDFGGRLYSLYNKRDDRELLFKNPVFQPANIALRDAWISGGIEWNIGRTGHTYHTSAPVFFERCIDEAGEDYLVMSEYDRCEGLCYSIEFRLPDGEESLFAKVTIINPNNHDVPMYWWTNTAVRETPGLRVLAAADNVLCPGSDGLTLEKMPHLSSEQGKDVSFPSVYYHSNEYFFQVPKDTQYPWEAAVYPGEDWAFIEYSTGILRYRKMFTWGSHQGGLKWRDFLSEPGKGDYIEIQAGIGRTQMHGLTMPKNTTWTFEQVFTSISVDADALCKLNYSEAAKKVEQSIKINIPKFPDKKSSDFISLGSGWGALENHRRALRGISKLPIKFPEESIGTDELPWLSLLHNGILPDNTDSFMTGGDWADRLKKSPGNAAKVHLGIIYFEDGLEDKAAELWESALPHPLAYRNLSLIKLNSGDLTKAAELMEKALTLDSSYAYLTEYARILIQINEYEKCFLLLEKLADDAPARLWIFKAQAAWHTGRIDLLGELFTREYSCIREGENTLTDLWFLWAEKTNQSNKTNPPANIDFRQG